MSLETIRERHSRLEGMAHTQSVEIKQEISSQAHKDRGWLLNALESATEQNEQLFQELGRLEAAVDALGEKEPPKKRKRQEAVA